MEEKITAQQVRHCSLPWLGLNTQRNDGRVMRLSIWDKDRGVVNLYLVAEDAKTALMLVSRVLIVVHEYSLHVVMMCDVQLIQLLLSYALGAITGQPGDGIIVCRV